MTDLSEFGAGIDSEQATTSGSVGYRRGDCKALTGSGRQCENTPTGRDGLCSVHERTASYRLRRVDEFDGTPTPALRDALRDECGIRGRRAYALSTLADDVQELWDLLTDHDAAPLEVGENTHSFRRMVDFAAQVAKHPDLSVDGELFAERTCIAKSGSGDRCSHSGSGPLRLCSTHQDTKTVTVIRKVRDEYARVRDDPTIETKR